jgi:hypothetical protein
MKMPTHVLDDIIIIGDDSDNSYDYNDDDETSSYNDEIDYDGVDDYDDIFSLEETYIDSEKQNNQYVIGISSDEGEYELLACSVTPSTFFKFTYKRILNYLFYYSTVYVPAPKINIIKINVSEDQCYISINKTYWLKLIQRHWKKTYKIKQSILSKRHTIPAIQYFAIHGKYPAEYYKFPGLSGMLSCYAK